MVPNGLVMVVDDESPEPIVPALQRALGADAVSVWPLSHLLADSGVTFLGGKVQSGSDAFRDGRSLGCILDRVIEITPATVMNVDDSGLSTIGLVSDAYQAVLERYAGGYNPDALYSTVGRVVPLFAQWAHVTNVFSDFDVPTYAYGYGPEIIADDAVPNAIHKSPFDLYNWKPNIPPSGPVDDSFVVSRPLGRPILSYVIGDHVAVLPLDNGTGYDQGPLLKMTPLVASSFGASIGEILWFDDDGKVTFAAFSHKLFAAVSDEAFKGHAETIHSQLTSIGLNWNERTS